MIDQVTSGSGEPPSPAMILKQFAQAAQNFETEMESLQDELSRLGGELKAWNEELEALRAAPGDHQTEIADLEQTITLAKSDIVTTTDAIKGGIQQYRTDVDTLSATLAALYKTIKDPA